MADIFVSYATPDRDRVIPLVEALEAQGWTVWWDRDLVAGADFDRRIEAALDAAKCVVVAWSEHAVESRWCRAEASEGLDRKILVPIRLDEVRPPLAFRNVQTAALPGWPSDPGELNVFLAGVRECLGNGSPETKAPVAPTRSPTRRAWLPYAGAGLLVVLLAIWMYETRRDNIAESTSQESGPAERANVPRNSLAVLPFENLSPDPDNAFFSAGIHIETLNQLAKIKGFSVIARVAMDDMVNSDKSVAEIGQELNVTAVMSGSVRFARERVRVAVQLVDVDTGIQLWSETYDHDLDDIFAIQSDIAQNITSAMQVSFDVEAQQSIAAIPTENLEAYSAYLRGLAVVNQIPLRLLEGVREFETAVSLDPTFADALGANAMFRATMIFSASPTPEAEAENLRSAQSLAHRALDLNPRQTTALLALSYVSLANRRWEENLAYAKQAYELSPNGQLEAYLYAEALSGNGYADEAIPLFDRAFALNPLNPHMPANGVIFMEQNGRLNQARRYARMAIDIAPDFYVPYAWAASVEAKSGNLDEATSLLKEAEARFPPDSTTPLGPVLIATYTLTGRHGAADRELQKLLEQEPRSDSALFHAYLHLGVLDKALDHAHTAVDKGFPKGFVSGIAQRWNLPPFEPLHGHPRFIELLDKLGVDHAMK